VYLTTTPPTSPGSGERAAAFRRSLQRPESARRCARCWGSWPARPEITLFIDIKQASLIQFGHDHVVSQVLEVTRPWRSQCVLISSDLAAIHRARRLGDAPSAGD